MAEQFSRMTAGSWLFRGLQLLGNPALRGS
jgi:hypothetical protein